MAERTRIDLPTAAVVAVVFATSFLVVGAVFASLASAAPRAEVAVATKLKCPLKPSSSLPSGEAWAFHDTGPPSTPHPGVVSSYVHGRGGWGAGHGSGTVCREDKTTAGATNAIVLTASGPARTAPHVTRLAHLGVELTLKVAVAASDDPACSAGSAGTLAIFASYYESHVDSVQMRFPKGCQRYDATFQGPALYALVAENGRQVN